MNEYFRLGIISSTHGVRGEVKVYPTTDDVNRIKKLKSVFLYVDGKYIPTELEGVKYFKNMVILKFKGIDSLNDVEKYKGKEIYVDRENAVSLSEDEYYVADILGMNAVSDDNIYKGVVKDILNTAANDVLVIKLDNDTEILVPVIKACVKKVDIDNNTLIFHVLDGLI